MGITAYINNAGILLNVTF